MIVMMGKTSLELFSGTGRLGNVAEIFGYDVVSVLNSLLLCWSGTIANLTP